jgi:ribonuclease P protein subunit POP4
MKVDASILKQEFIGLQAKVFKSTNSSCVGLLGRVIDETRDTFTVERKGKQKIIIKEPSLFHFVLSNGIKIEVDGKSLVGRPEDRVKKNVRRSW